MLSDEKIGTLIRDKRKKLNLTQTQLGEKLGVGAAAVNKWEQGKVTNIKRTVLQQLSKVLNIHPALLIGFDFQNESIDRVEFSDEEFEEIKRFAEYVKSKRK